MSISSDVGLRRISSECHEISPSTSNNSIIIHRGLDAFMQAGNPGVVVVHEPIASALD
jgi:hypothetical protein